MVRVFVLYDEQPDPERYEQHVVLSREHVPGSVIRHGRVLGTGCPTPTPPTTSSTSSRTATRGKAAQDGLMAAGKDAMEMGIPFRVYFSEIS